MKAAGIIGALLFAGGVYAGIKYYEKYRKDHAELEKDFSEFEEDDEKAFSADENTDFCENTDPDKKYTSLSAHKDELFEAAKTTLEAAKGMVEPAKGMVKNIGEIISEKVDDSSIVANDYVATVKEKVGNIVVETKDKIGAIEEDVLNRNSSDDETTDDVIIDMDKPEEKAEEKIKEGNFKETEN